MYVMSAFSAKISVLCLILMLYCTRLVASSIDGRTGPDVRPKAMIHPANVVPKSSFDLDFLRNCIREKVTVVTCTGRHLRRVPRGIPGDTTRLNLTDNLFKALGPKTFPRMPNLKLLDLSRNRISSIWEGTFNNTINLTILYLNHNNITTIRKGAFDGLVSLEVLGLAYTGLCNLNSVAFLTPNLKTLNFTSFAGNGVRQCKLGKEFGNLKRLAYLDLADNNIAHLDNDCFAPLKESLVGTLDLSSNHIQAITQPVFWPFRNLSYLFLGGNRFDMKHLNTTFENLNSINTKALYLSFYNCTFLSGVTTPLNTTFERLATLPITQLDLSYVGLRKLPERGLFSFFPRLESLVLVGNNITDLPPFAFSGLGNLKTLDMTKNTLPNVPKGSFRSLDNLTSLSLTLAKGRSEIHGSVFARVPNLKYLTISGPTSEFAVGKFTQWSLRGLRYLENLRITWHDLPEVPSLALELVRATLRRLSFLHGHISILEPRQFRGFGQLESLDFRYNKLAYLPEHAFDGLRNLTELKLSHNYVKIIDPTAFLGLTALKILYLETNRLCVKSTDDFPPPFTDLSSLESLHLEDQYSKCYNGGFQSFPPDFFAGLVSLKRLHVGRNYLKKMLEHEETSRPFANLTTLEVLDLELNSFDSITSLPFENLETLTTLYLQFNRIPTIPDKLFKSLPKLRKLILNSNRNLGKLTKEGIGFLQHLEKLNLEDNPLQCTCQEEWFYDWVVSNKTTTLFYNLSNYGCVSPERLVHKTILVFDAEAQGCNSKVGLHLAISGAVLLVVFLVGVVVGYRNRWYIKYGCFVVKARFHGYQALRDANVQKKFDAFVSYNHNDRAWVMNELVPHLEGGYDPDFRLCLDYRDFAAGAPITDNIVNAIYDSRKTICVVTEEFLKSEWCEMEVQMATYRLFDEHVDVLILVFLEDIPEGALHRYHRLRRLMCKRTYLEWPKDPQGKAIFWERLKDALKTGDKPPIENII